jgi:hypothetical protein
MQAMLEEATAAAERGAQTTSDQQYLSEILGECGTCMVLLALAARGLTQ